MSETVSGLATSFAPARERVLGGRASGERIAGQRLRSLRIGVRLTCCFGLLSLVLTMGAAAAIWQIHFYNTQVEELSSIDRRVVSVLKVHNQVLAFREIMQTAAIDENANTLEKALIPFRAAFVKNVAEASGALKDSQTKDKSLQRTVYTLLSYETAIPGQIDAVLELARHDDWQAIHYRLQNQILHTSRVLTNIVGDIEKNANAERKTTIQTMAEIRYRVMGILPLSCVLVLLTSGIFLGAHVTRSIAGPLAELETGARALGSGIFSHRVTVRGKDELAPVAVAFNNAAEQIQTLHSGLEAVVAERTAELRVAVETLQKLSAQDPLTGIANRRTLNATLEREFSRAIRCQSPISLLMVDVDHFKGLNDAYGHQKGDECLTLVARALQSLALRGEDLIARYGGEEFAVVLTNTDMQGALSVAERLRSSVEDLGIPNAGSPLLKRLSVSIGVATVFPGNLARLSSWVERADQALYRAKQEGRNRVCV